jgi:hypothetical protein
MARHLGTAQASLIGLAALEIELHDAGLDDHPARPEPSGGVPLPAAAIPGEGELRAAASGIEPAASLPGRIHDPVGVAAGLADGCLDLLHEGLEALVGGS